MHVSKFRAVLLMLICCVTLFAPAAVGEEKDGSLEVRIPARSIKLAEKAMDVALSPDGKLVSVWDYEKRLVTVRNADTGQIRFTRDIISEIGNHFQFSPDSQFLAVVDEHGTIHLWDVDAGTEQQAFPANHVLISEMAFSSDGKTLACSSGRNQDVLLWDVASGRKLQSLPQEFALVLAFSPDGKLLATSDTAEQITIWSCANGERIRMLDDMDSSQTDMAHSLAFLRDNTTLISCHGRCRPYGRRFYGLRIWDVTTGALKAELTTEASAVLVAISPDEGLAAVVVNPAGGTRFSEIVLFDLRKQQHIFSFPGHRKSRSGGDGVTALQFSRSGKQLLSAGRDGTLKYWDLSAVLKEIVPDEEDSRGEEIPE